MSAGLLGVGLAATGLAEGLAAVGLAAGLAATTGLGTHLPFCQTTGLPLRTDGVPLALVAGLTAGFGVTAAALAVAAGGLGLGPTDPADP